MDIRATEDAIDILYALLADELMPGRILRIPRPVEYVIIGRAILHLRDSLHLYLTGNV